MGLLSRMPLLSGRSGSPEYSAEGLQSRAISRFTSLSASLCPLLPIARPGGHLTMGRDRFRPLFFDQLAFVLSLPGQPTLRVEFA